MVSFQVIVVALSFSLILGELKSCRCFVILASRICLINKSLLNVAHLICSCQILLLLFLLLLAKKKPIAPYWNYMLIDLVELYMTFFLTF
jgi:hypothetical protein